MDSPDKGLKEEGMNMSGDNNSGLTELELGNDDVIGFLKQKFKWICIMHSCSFKASFSFSNESR